MATKKIGKLHAHEVRRCRILLSLGTNPSNLPEQLRQYLHTGRELVLPRNTLDSNLQSLTGAGFHVLSISQRLNKLSLKDLEIKKSAIGDHGIYSLPQEFDFPNTVCWTLDPQTRHLRRYSPSKHAGGGLKLSLRKSTPLMLSLDGRRGIFLANESGQISAIRRLQDHLWSAHKACHRTQIQYIRANDFLILDIDKLWLPPYHRRLLQNVLPLAPVKGSYQLAMYHAADLEFLKGILSTLNIELSEASEPKEKKTQGELLKTIGKLFRGAYSDYLKNQNRVDDFLLMVRLRLWERISDARLKDIMKSISNKAFDFDLISLAILDYIESKLAISLDWKTAKNIDYGPDIFGLAIEYASGEFMGHKYNYYRACLPMFQLSLGINTQYSIAPWWKKGGLPPTFILDHWRCYPYLGRMKLTRGEPPVRGTATADEIKAAKVAMLGIPEIEHSLRDSICLSAFQLDMSPTRAQAGIEFSREFTFYGKLIDVFSTAFASPVSLLQDIRGFYFYLEWDSATFEYVQDTLHFQYRNKWVYGMARMALIEGHLNTRNYPVYQMVKGVALTPASFERALKDSIAAYVKYYWEIDKKKLFEFFKDLKVSNVQIDEQIAELIKEKRLLAKGDALLFSWPDLESNDALAFHSAVNSEEIELWNPKTKNGAVAKEFIALILPLLCPLHFGLPLSDETNINLYTHEKEYLLRKKGRIIACRGSNHNSYLNNIREAFKEDGVVRLVFPEWRLRMADSLLVMLEAEMKSDLFVLRKDNVEFKGDDKPGTMFVLASKKGIKGAIFRSKGFNVTYSNR